LICSGVRQRPLLISGPFLLPFLFPLSYVLLSTIDIYFHLLSCLSLRFSKGKQSCFACSDSFLAVTRASGPIYMFCAIGLVFGGTEGVGSRFYVVRSRTSFWRYRGRRIQFSCFTRPKLFSAVPRVSSHVFMFCAPRLIFGGTVGVGSRFDV
jgi:hypothetical protein